MSCERLSDVDLMFSSSPLPSSCDDYDRRVLSSQNGVVPCQPTEDEDLTVTDAMTRSTLRNPDIFRATFDESCLVDIHGTVRRDNDAHGMVRQGAQRHSRHGLNFPIEEVTSSPAEQYSATRSKQISMIEGDEISECDVDLHSTNFDHLIKIEHDRNNHQVFHDGPGKKDHKMDRAENQDLRQRAETGPVPDEVDWPGRTVGSADCEDVSTLERNYQKLLRKHQQFIVSNVQLHEKNEELMNRVTDLERELERTRMEIEQQELDKMQFVDQINSLQKALDVLKDQIPMLKSPCDGTDIKNDEPGEWTSSLKEELRQTMILVMTQQQQLNELYQVIKRQNEAIRRLRKMILHSINDRKALSECEVLPNELQLRQKPEGSSVLVPTEERSKVGSSQPFTIKNMFSSRTGQKEPQDKNLQSKLKALTTSTFNRSSKPWQTPEVANGNKQTHEPSRNLAATTVKGPPTMYQNTAQVLEHAVDRERSNFDLEHSSFVIVDPNQIEIRICPLCGTEFLSDTATLDEFVEHVSRCNPPEDSKQCPVCFMKFEEKLTNSQIEMHVNEHFDEDRFQCLSPSETNC